MLSLKEMRDIIARGESVMYRGVVISSENISELPTDAELALESGSQDVIVTTKENLEEELSKLQAQLRMLNTQSQASTSEAVAPSANDADSRKGRIKPTV